MARDFIVSSDPWNVLELGVSPVIVAIPKSIIRRATTLALGKARDPNLYQILIRAVRSEFSTTNYLTFSQDDELEMAMLITVWIAFVKGMEHEQQILGELSRRSWQMDAFNQMLNFARPNTDHTPLYVLMAIALGIIYFGFRYHITSRYSVRMESIITTIFAALWLYIKTWWKTPHSRYAEVVANTVVRPAGHNVAMKLAKTWTHTNIKSYQNGCLHYTNQFETVDVCCDGSQPPAVGEDVVVKMPLDPYIDKYNKPTCVPRVGATFLGVGVYGKYPFQPRGCIHNEVYGAQARLLRPLWASKAQMKANKRFWEQVGQLLSYIIQHRFIDRGLTRVKPLNLIDIMVWAKRFPPQRRELMLNAFAEMLDDPHGITYSSHFYASGFVKKEHHTKTDYNYVNGSIVKDVKARIICQRSPLYQALTGPYVFSVTTQLKRIFNFANIRVNGFAMVIGYNAEEIGAMFEAAYHYMVALHGSVVVVCKDASNWDGSLSQYAIAEELAVYRTNFPLKEDHPFQQYIYDAMRAQLKTKLETRNGVIYKFSGRRKSGDNNTTGGNSLLNGGATVTALSRLGLRPGIDSVTFVGGDDDLSLLPGNCAKLADEMVKLLNKESGLVLKTEFYSSMYRADFYSGRMYPAYTQSTHETVWVYGPKIARALCKTFYCRGQQHVANGEKKLKWLKGVALGMNYSWNFIPVLRAVKQTILNHTKQVDAIPIILEKHKPLSTALHECCDQTWDMVAAVYGVSQDDVLQLESEILQAHQLPFLIQHPVINAMVQVDMPDEPAIEPAIIDLLEQPTHRTEALPMVSPERLALQQYPSEDAQHLLDNMIPLKDHVALPVIGNDPQPVVAPLRPRVAMSLIDDELTRTRIAFKSRLAQWLPNWLTVDNIVALLKHPITAIMNKFGVSPGTGVVPAGGPLTPAAQTKAVLKEFHELGILNDWAWQAESNGTVLYLEPEHLDPLRLRPIAYEHNGWLVPIHYSITIGNLDIYILTLSAVVSITLLAMAEEFIKTKIPWWVIPLVEFVSDLAYYMAGNAQSIYIMLLRFPAHYLFYKLGFWRGSVLHASYNLLVTHMMLNYVGLAYISNIH
jgi:hypothetical protein